MILKYLSREDNEPYKHAKRALEVVSKALFIAILLLVHPYWIRGFL
ncbi:hypothetical protein DFQ12_4645 [Sphingobacterium detergens]|uniref:Uncharacterized protein n=1 Tax=Sphingobacterium detergens TaxID=1145106 RepID=A0A420AMA5_SPHD1|nr:hypothetical protein DFQ12_4645 [Sphingobacterium detergens]